MIIKDLPRPDTSRFSQISPELLVLSYLFGSKRAIARHVENEVECIRFSSEH